MSSPHVKQAQFLNRIFREALIAYAPRSVAVPGCATGNGFEHLDAAITARVTGIDINREYLEALHSRFSERLPGLELVCSDLSEFELKEGAFDLIYCALVFEYLDPAVLMKKAAGWLNEGGTVVVILQLPSEKTGKVSETPYKSLKRLEPIMKLVDPDLIRRAAAESKLTETANHTETLESGKAFFVAHYRLRIG